MPARPVDLGAPAPDLVEAALALVRPGDVAAGLRLAAELGADVPLPAGGRTVERWSLMASVAAADLTAARALEPHLDALAVLAEEGTRSVPPGSTWGVYAAERPGTRLSAAPDGDGGWRLDGEKPWCSLADRVSHALVTAHVDDGRRLFAVDLRDGGVDVADGTWHARGLAAVTSGSVTFRDVPARAVGDPGWYLQRPGFAHGGIGVAACWYGGAVGLARSLLEAVRRREPDQLALWHLGEADLDLQQAGLALRHAAAEVDAGRATGAAGELLALRTRSVVAAAAERVVGRAGHALGPAPLTLDDEHARRVADLTVYLRQHHAERDVARLGAVVAATDGGAGW